MDRLGAVCRFVRRTRKSNESFLLFGSVARGLSAVFSCKHIHSFFIIIIIIIGPRQDSLGNHFLEGGHTTKQRCVR
jgi:hypothetical protein